MKKHLLQQFMLVAVIGITSCSTKPDDTNTVPVTFEKQAPGTYTFTDPDNATAIKTYLINEDMHLFEVVDGSEDLLYYFESIVLGDETRAYYASFDGTYIGVEVVTGGIVNGEAGKTLSLFKDTAFVIDIKDFADKDSIKWEEINRINSTVPKIPADPNSFEVLAPGTYTFAAIESGSIETIYTVNSATLDIYVADVKKYDFVAKVVDDVTKAHYQNSDTDKYIGVEVVTGGIVNGDAGKTLSLFKDKSAPAFTTEWISTDDVDFAEENRINSGELPVKPWEVVGDSTGISTSTVTSTSSVVDSSGNLYVMYGDGTPRVKKYDGSSWTTMDITAAGIVREGADIIIDNTGNIYVTAVYDGLPKVWKLPAGTSTWEDITPTGLVAGGKAGYRGSSVAVNKDGKLYFSYTANIAAIVMEYSAANWTRLGTTSIVSCGFTSLAVHPTAGDVFVAAAGRKNKDYSLKIYKWDGGTTTWVQTPKVDGGATADALPVQEIDLKYNSNGDLYIAYLDGSNGSKGTVRKFSGTAWELVGVKTFTDGFANAFSMGFDQLGNPIVAHSGDIGGAAWNGDPAPAKAYIFLNGSWGPIGTGQVSTGNAENSSVAIHSDGTIYVSYGDLDNDNKLSVRKFLP